MKKILLLVTVSVLAFHITGNSQKTRAGVVGGVVLSSMSGELNGNKNDYEMRPGLTIGMMVDCPFNQRWSFFPGLHFVQKGTNQEPPYGTLITKSYVALRYAELNANFIYKAPGTKGNFIAGIGPSLAMPLPSKKGSVIDKDKTEEEIKFGNTIDKDINGVDYGANFLIGYRFAKGFFANLNYNMGIRDLRPDEVTTGESIKNQYFSLQIGWLLPNKDK
jgi:Outer membrane protein beta-barrel domain